MNNSHVLFAKGEKKNDEDNLVPTSFPLALNPKPL